MELDYGHMNEDDNVTNTTYTDFAILNTVKKTEQPPQPAWKILRTYGGLIAGATNEFSIVLASNSPAATKPSYLDVANAIVITNISDGILGPQTNGIFPLIATVSPKEVTLILKPLPAGQSVDFNLLDGKEVLVTNLNHQIVNPQTSSQSAGSPKPQ